MELSPKAESRIDTPEDGSVGSCRAGQSDVSPRVYWRLLGANNRELGHSAEIFGDHESCRLAASYLKACLDDAEELLAFDGAAHWRWALLLHGRHVAVGSRSYLRRVECLYAQSQFLLYTRTAPVVDGVHRRR